MDFWKGYYEIMFGFFKGLCSMDCEEDLFSCLLVKVFCIYYEWY